MSTATSRGPVLRENADRAIGFALDHPHRFPLVFAERFVEQELGEHRDARQRVVQLVRDTCDELAECRELLRLVHRLRERAFALAATAFRGRELGVAESGRDLARQVFEETPLVFTEAVGRLEPQDEDAVQRGISG
jgi:hypothetical protein